MRIMFRSLTLICSLFISLLANADWIEDSDKNAMLVLRSQASFQPESVASYGLTEFDGDIFDLNADFSRRQDDSDRELLVELKNRLANEENQKVRQDLEILIQSLNDEIETRRIDNKHMLLYLDMHRTMFGSFNTLLDPRNERERYAKALERLRKYNGSEDGYTPITELAKARSGEGFENPDLLGPYIVELQKDLSDAPRYIAGLKDLFARRSSFRPVSDPPSRGSRCSSSCL